MKRPGFWKSRRRKSAEKQAAVRKAAKDVARRPGSNGHRPWPRDAGEGNSA